MIDFQVLAPQAEQLVAHGIGGQVIMPPTLPELLPAVAVSLLDDRKNLEAV